MGSKAALAQRLFNHFKPSSAAPGSSFSIIPGEEESDIPYPTEARPNSDRPAKTNIVGLSLADLRSNVRHEISSALTTRLANTTCPLSPPSVLLEQESVPPKLPHQAPRNTSQAQPLPTNIESEQQPEGNISSFFANSSSLPPISNKIFKAVKDSQFVDFNTLLPNALYTPIS